VIQYIKELLREMGTCLSDPEEARAVQSRMVDVMEGTNRLDPVDFMQSSQALFVNLRRRVRQWHTVAPDWWQTLAEIGAYTGTEERHGLDQMLRMKPMLELGRDVAYTPNGREMALRFLIAIRNSLKELERVLDEYRGEGFGYPKREFLFVKDADLKRIVERDYQELRMKAFPSEAYKSAVILAGSILEALLYDIILRDAVRTADAMSWGKAPARFERGKQVQCDIKSQAPEDAWKLEDLIDVCEHKLHVLPPGNVDLIHRALRNHRNLVHPRAEIRSKISVGLGEAHVAIGALEIVVSHFETKYP
jgi:hypothetical protein